MSGEYVRSLFVTLRRGLAGKPWFHQRIVKSLGLRERHHCVEKPNNAMIRGMLSKIPHLVIVETDKMFYLRRMKQHYESLPRSPWVAEHGNAAAAHIQQHALEQQARAAVFKRQAQAAAAAERLTPSMSMSQTSDTSALLWSKKSTHSQPTLETDSSNMLDSVTATEVSTSANTVPKQRRKLPPLSLAEMMRLQGPVTSPLLAPHIEEHVLPLPQGEQSRYRYIDTKAIGQRIKRLSAKRHLIASKKGLYHASVKRLNERIMKLRQRQADLESQHRFKVLLNKHTPGPHHARVRGLGMGSRKGLKRAARSKSATRYMNVEKALNKVKAELQNEQTKKLG